MTVREWLRDAAETLLVPFLAPFVLRRITRSYEAVHESMIPAIRPGDRVVVLLLAHCGAAPLAWGDVVVFESWHEGQDTAMKRVTAYPSEQIAVHDYTVFVDGAVLDEPYTVPPTHGIVRRARQRAGDYFLTGDDRPRSRDSRSHGPATSERIVGRAIFRCWPCSRIASFG